MRKLSDYYIPVIAFLLTLVIVVTAVAVTYLAPRDTLGPWWTGLALVLYSAGLCGIFAWVRLCFGRPGSGKATRTVYRTVLGRVSQKAADREGIRADGSTDGEMAKRK